MEDSHGDALAGAAAVVFEAELGFEGVVHRFDDLSQSSQLGRAWATPLVAAGWADQFDTVVGESALELRRGVSLVGDDDLTVAAGEEAEFGFEHVDGDVAFIDFRVGQSEDDRQPGRVRTRCSRSPQK